MKKLLLATAAVMALSASAAQAEIKLDLGGYFKGYAGYANQDETPTTGSLRQFDIKRKSQIYFDGETTLDNGLTVGYHGELYQENDATLANGQDQLEESYLYFSGNWGRFNAGRSNGAAYLLQVAAPGADSNIDGQDISISFYNAQGAYHQDYKQAGIEGTTGIAAAQYADKITYLTPKFNGFQAGISYSPSVDQKVIGDSTAGMETDSDAGDYENAYDAAARYDGEFSGVGVHVGGGYSHASTEADLAGPGAGSDDYNEWNAGVKLTYEGFGFGGAYNRDNGGSSGSGDTKDWTVGADYTWGAYVFGASYFDSNADSDDSELQRYALGATYTFGPGMQFRGAVAYYNEDLAAGAPDNDATVVTLGTDIQF